MLSFVLFPLGAALLRSVASAAPVDELEERSLLDTLNEDFDSLLNDLNSAVNKTNVTEGVLQDFWSIPSESDIKDHLGLNDSAIAELPLEFLNIPGYANYTSQGWNLRIHGQAYKEPLSNTSVVPLSTLDSAANFFLPDFDISQLTPPEQDNARNLTSKILSLPQEDITIQFQLTVSKNQTKDQTFTSGWNATIIWGTPTDPRGELDGFVTLPTVQASDLPNGNETTAITRLDVHTNVTSLGNATAYLVPETGITIVNDIDDILRVTKIYEPEQGLLNTFARNFTPWLDMDKVYANWSTLHPDYHFHYLTTTPEQGTTAYMNFIYNWYPLGSFDTRPLNFTTIDQTFSIRKVLLEKVIETFPNRKFVLVGDTTNPDVMRDYPLMAQTYDNIQCILLRNTSATDSGDNFPYDTSGFKPLNQSQYMFFYTPDDIAGLDFSKGDCRNSTVVERLTYGYQNLPLGIKDQGSLAAESVKRVSMGLIGVIVGFVVGLLVV